MYVTLEPTVERRRVAARSAFTLLEVLAVLAVIGVLAALLLPVLQTVRERGRQAVCMGNLKQLYAAFALYAQDYNGHIPPHSNNIDQCVYNHPHDIKQYKMPERGKQLVQVMSPYTKSQAIWFCPSDALAGTNSQQGYLDRRFSSYHTPWRLTLRKATTLWPLELSDPWRNGLASADSSQGLVFLSDESWTAPISYLSDENNKITRPFIPHLFSHNGQFNCLYFDGHVKSRSQSLFYGFDYCYNSPTPPTPLP